MTATPTPTPVDPIALAAQVAAVFTRTHRVAYAHIAPDLTLVHASPDFDQLVDDPTTPIAGQSLLDCLGVFVGAEEDLFEVLRDEADAVVLEQVNQLRPDGSIAYLTYRVTRLAEGGLLLVVEDVTEASVLQQHVTQDRNELRLVQAQLSRANAELQRLNRFKSLVLSMAAHDLRSPLTVVRGYADLLLKALDRGVAVDREAIVTILSQANRQNEMITNLLNLDQIDRGQLVVTPIACDFVELVREVIKAVQPMAELNDVALGAELPGSAVMIQADPDRVRQILHNIIGNALKYTPEAGRVQIELQVDQAAAVLRVADTGPGMTPDQISHLFQAYYRTDDARESQIEGSGLGLFIVKTLIDAQHGQVSVKSEIDRGTTFTVRLPLAETHDGD